MGDVKRGEVGRGVRKLLDVERVAVLLEAQDVFAQQQAQPGAPALWIGDQEGVGLQAFQIEVQARLGQLDFVAALHLLTEGTLRIEVGDFRQQGQRIGDLGLAAA